MGLPLRQVLDEAMQLPEKERRALAEELLDSVEGETEETWEESWLAELRRRSAEGHDDARPWPEVQAEILRRIGKS
ncbi:MAG: addiction module protein [Pseudomonadota bacterium]|nr:addiction module protein [Pseudomonadota bacterium]